MIQVKVWENTILAKKLLSKLENIGDHISTSEMGNLKVPDEVNLFRNWPLIEFELINLLLFPLK